MSTSSTARNRAGDGTISRRRARPDRTYQLRLTGDGGGTWAVSVGGGKMQREPRCAAHADPP